jgi:hypothetical protein
MKPIRYLQIGVVALLLAALLLKLFIIPNVMKETAHSSAVSERPINATIYITTDTLQQIFQNRMNQMVNGAFSGFMSKLPAQDRVWASQMAEALLQPSALLTSLVPQNGGFNTAVQVKLYPNDPQPIKVAFWVSFQAVSSSAMQVSVKPLNGSPSLANGPVATVQVPIGQLSAVNIMPSCGNAALALGLQIPISLGQTSTSASQSQPAATPKPESQPQPQKKPQAAISIELPASSLATIGKSMPSFAMGNNMTASNISISVQSTNLVINSTLYWGSVNIGSATTQLIPGTINGRLAVHILNTTVNLLHIIPFPYNLYNQSLEQSLNARLSTAFPSSFTISQATIGPNSALPCAKSTSLVLNGATSSLGA